ncbi:hypothetical protein SAMN02910357_02323 [Succinivibrio dextrinosolvens]|uniref:hypothetical protein n=1 Tax=Succinivibrio dextrinosolvens TaxID=83771 RepID=UPI0008E2545F|nr:hypothetical protein [Succinivibrio dextrinosolvens]SFS87291.1 hypothetical protein SAMN02910357_02323 [Succinivibrio dextrinosolvens]
MVFVASFVIFLLFVLGLSLGLIFRKKPLVSEDEATAAIMGDIACSTCQQMCAMAGRTKVSKKVKDKIKCNVNDLNEVEIPHKDV